MNLNTTELENIISNLNSPFVLVGDFNAHSDTWGSSKNNRRGKDISDLLDLKNLIVLNNGSHTHFSPSYNTFSCIDLTISTASIASKFVWKVVNDLHGSDHFPISLDLLDSKIEKTKRPKWKIKDANWDLFNPLLPPPNHTANLEQSIDASVVSFSESVIQSALASIPMTSSKSSRVPVPWWSEDIKTAIKNRKKL